MLRTHFNRVCRVFAVSIIMVVYAPAFAQGSPANDDFVNAITIVGDGTWSGTNIDATFEIGEPNHAASGGVSIWFQWHAVTDGYFTVDTFGSDFDTTLAVYTGSTVDSLTSLGANDQAGGNQSEVANVPIAAGEVYRVAVDGYFGSTGQVVLNWSYWDGVDVTPPQAFIGNPFEGATYVLYALIPATYACADETLGSGISSCEGDVSVNLPVDTTTFGDHIFTVTATDHAGNVGSSSVTYTVSGVDISAPQVTIQSPVDGVSIAQAGLLIAEYNCVDEDFGTGIASCVGNVENGGAIDTSQLGSFPFTVTGTDNSGNTSELTVIYDVVNSQPNDNFVNAVALAQSGSLAGSNVGATRESGEPGHAFNQGGASVWYTWTALQNGYLTVDTFGSDFDTLLAVYSGGSVNDLTEVASNNNTAGFQSRVTGVAVTAGSSYAIVVDGWNGASGNIALSWSWSEQFDTIPPTVDFWRPAEGQVIAQGDSIFAGFACFDPSPGSGLALCEGNSPNGVLMDTSLPGEFVFTVTSLDNAGNSTVVSHNYTIVANPANDDFDDAQVISANGSVSGTNNGATEESGEPWHGGSVSSSSVWFRFTAPADGFLTANTLGSDFDTVLAIYSGSSVMDLVALASNDNTVGSTSEIKDVRLTAGVSYSIVISGVFGETGTYSLNWSFLELNDTTSPAIEVASPSNGAIFFEGVSVAASYSCTDDVLGSGIATCSGNVLSGEFLDTAVSGQYSFTVSGVDNAGNSNTKTVNYSVVAQTNDNLADALPLMESGSIVASNDGATTEAGEPDHAGTQGGASIWFAWTAPQDGSLSIDTYFSDFDTTLAVYTGSDFASLIEIASNDNSLGSQSEIEDMPVIQGITYYIAVDGSNGAFGQIDLDWSLFIGPTFSEISPVSDPLWVTDAEHDFWLNAAAPADVDGDGDIDLAVIGFFVEYNVSAVNRLVLFLNEGEGANGNWNFAQQEVALDGIVAGGSDLAWGDFDNDGDPDLVVGSEGTTRLYRNDAGTLTAVSSDLPGYSEESDYSGAYDLRSLTWADYDNDGDLDLLIPSVYDSGGFSYHTKLVRNDGPDENGDWQFSEVTTPIDSTIHAQTAWADNDGDGDLDLFMANIDNFQDNGFVRVYENNNGEFSSEAPIGSLNIDYGLADWSDYDGDGDLDILIVGLVRDLDGVYKTLLRIYTNQEGNFVPTTVIESSFFPWLDLFAATWADYDSDGDVDILVTGSGIGPENIEGRSEVYVNEGGEFVPLGRDLPAPVSSSGRGGSFTWLDIDNDGDLDYFLAGAYYVEGGAGLIEAQMHLYRNDAVGINNRPQLAPQVQALVVDDAVTFNWAAGSDDSTPASSLTYELSVTSTEFNSPNSSRLPEPGKLGSITTWSLHDLPHGNYFWRLQAVDSAFNGSQQIGGQFAIGTIADADSDGVLDTQDNCSVIPNPGQIDSDGDGFGNRCDPDFDNNGSVNFVDIAYFRDRFLSNDSHADLNGDSVVNFADYVIMVSYMFLPPGPGAEGG